MTKTSTEFRGLIDLPRCEASGKVHVSRSQAKKRGKWQASRMGQKFRAYKCQDLWMVAPDADGPGGVSTCGGHRMKRLAESAIWTCTSAEYHAETAHISNSALSVFRQSRPLFAARYVLGTIPHPKPTEAMRFGSALHARVLEPDTWQDQVAVAPDVDRRTKAGKAEWQVFLDLAAGDKIVINQEQAEQMERMIAGIHANPFARSLLTASGRSEFAVRWQIDGVPVKCRFDRLLDAGLVIDLKTTSDPSPEAFGRSAYNFGYYRQGWIYQRGAVEMGVEGPEFLHLACGPHECAVYELDDHALQLGEQQVRQALADLRRCRETGDWSSPLSGRINTLSLPRWAFTN